MYSSLRSNLRRRLAGTTLRSQLIAAILVLVAVVCGVVGVATTFAVRQYMIGQLDGQLVAAGKRSSFAHGQPPPSYPDSGPSFLSTPGQAAGTVGALFRAGDVQAAVLDEYGRPSALATDQIAALQSLPPDGRPRHIDLGGLGDYRAVAHQERDGDIVVTALPLGDLEKTIWWLIGIEAVVAGGALLLAGIGGTAIVRLSLRPLDRVATTASRVSELELATGEVDLSVRVPDVDTDARTEVGRVGAALNRMLGHVGDALRVRHASEMRVRQFVADASHELRTPLAAIRGYAELTRRGKETVPPDVAHALVRVESESERMTHLVDDLLLLARLDSGRPLAEEPVDLSRLVVDAVSDARAAGPDHRWLLDVPEEVITVPGDPARLHQVLANLLANARTHTPPQTKVTASLQVRNGWAVVSVTDDGPGIPDALQPEVFERFARGDTSRSRAAGSTGLGLSIVAAVVEAHRGHVEVTSRPGMTSFVVRLPRAAQTTADA
jgi:two-component system, OmpR family, sensor kinase